MKYLVNRETKEHFVYRGLVPSENWDVVEADAEGWIKHDNKEECPLPDDCRAEVKTSQNKTCPFVIAAHQYYWKFIDSYRPILDKPKETRPTARVYLDVADDVLRNKRDQLYTAEGVRAAKEVGDLLSRLDAAHEAAAQIPDILAEIRERVGKRGYDLVARSPFVEMEQEPVNEEVRISFSSAPNSTSYGADMMLADVAVTKDETMTVVCHKSVTHQVANMLYHGLKHHVVDLTQPEPLGAEFESALMSNMDKLYDDTPEPDMSDWRSWKKGDLVTVHGKKVDYLPKRYTYEIAEVADQFVCVDGLTFLADEIERGDLRFHYRPETTPYMRNLRNWRPGDLVERVRDPVETCAKLGGVYRLTRVDTTEAGTDRAWYIGEDGSEFWSSPNNFRWHSRPEVKS